MLLAGRRGRVMSQAVGRFFVCVAPAGVTRRLETRNVEVNQLIKVLPAGAEVQALGFAHDQTTGKDRIRTRDGWVSLVNRVGEALLLEIPSREMTSADRLTGLQAHTSTTCPCPWAQSPVGLASAARAALAEAVSPRTTGAYVAMRPNMSQSHCSSMGVSPLLVQGGKQHGGLAPREGRQVAHVEWTHSPSVGTLSMEAAAVKIQAAVRGLQARSKVLAELWNTPSSNCADSAAQLSLSHPPIRTQLLALDSKLRSIEERFARLQSSQWSAAIETQNGTKRNSGHSTQGVHPGVTIGGDRWLHDGNLQHLEATLASVGVTSLHLLRSSLADRRLLRSAGLKIGDIKRLERYVNCQ